VEESTMHLRPIKLRHTIATPTMVILLFLAGCTSSSPYSEVASKIPGVPPGTGRVFYYSGDGWPHRPSYSSYVINIGPRRRHELKGGGFSYIDLRAGRHRISIDRGALPEASVFEFDLESGEVKFIAVVEEPAGAGSMGGVMFIPTPRRFAQPLIEKGVYSGPSLKSPPRSPGGSPFGTDRDDADGRAEPSRAVSGTGPVGDFPPIEAGKGRFVLYLRDVRLFMRRDSWKVTVGGDLATFRFTNASYTYVDVVPGEHKFSSQPYNLAGVPTDSPQVSGSVSLQAGETLFVYLHLAGGKGLWGPSALYPIVVTPDFALEQLQSLRFFTTKAEEELS